MSDPQTKMTDAAVETAIAEFIATIETLANHAPVRAALYASAAYKLLHRLAEETPDQRMLLEYIEAAAYEIEEDLPNEFAVAKVCTTGNISAPGSS